MRAGIGSFLRQEPLLLAMLALALVGVTGVYWFSGVPQMVESAAGNERPRIQWLPDQTAKSTPAARHRNQMADLLDPSLMSLPSDHGFSKPMRKSVVAATQRASDWHNEPAYLDAKTNGEFPALLQQRSLVEYVQSSADRVAATPEEPTDGEVVETPPSVNESVFRATAALATRPVVRAPRLPRIISDTPIRPTSVRVGVAADGTVRFATIERATGDDTVDAQAVELARQIRFEPQGGSDALAWGVLRFLWATEPPAPAANATSAAHP